MVAQIKAAAKQFWDQWDEIDVQEIYHYTSVETACKILIGRELWASDVLSMNDTSEFRHALSIVDQALMSRWSEIPIHLAEYFRPRTLLLLGQTWDAFAACCSSNGDLLSQWRAYPPGSNAEGVSVGFRVGELYKIAQETQAFALVKINYCSDDLRKAVHHICDTALDIASRHTLVWREIVVFWSEVALLLLSFSLRFKNPDFTDEREWRILKLHPDKSGVMRRNQDGSEIKFIRIAFNAESVSQINVGRRAPRETESQLRRFLDSNGYQAVKIQHSEIAFR